jgi:hypothetical protein
MTTEEMSTRKSPLPNISSKLIPGIALSDSRPRLEKVDGYTGRRIHGHAGLHSPNAIDTEV